jgi:hypothetical protein
MLTSKRKPPECPSCGSKKVAQILWGYPAFSRKLEKNLKEGKIVLGGCIVSGNDPEWQCVDCKVEIYREGQGRLGLP